MNLLDNTYRLVDENIRPGNTPTDALIVTRKVTGALASEKVKVPFVPGTQVAYAVMNIVEVDADNEITVVTTGSTEPAYIEIFGKSINLQISGDAL